MRPILNKQLCHFILLSWSSFCPWGGLASCNCCHTLKHLSLSLKMSPTCEENDTWRLSLEVQILNNTNTRTARVRKTALKTYYENC